MGLKSSRPRIAIISLILLMLLMMSLGCTIVIERPSRGQQKTILSPEARFILAPSRSAPLTPTVEPFLEVSPTFTPTTEVTPSPTITKIITPSTTPIPTASVIWPTSTPTSPPTASPIVYVVQSGDTLSAIAKRVGLDNYQIIADFNQLSNPSQIEIGQKLLIPQNKDAISTVPAATDNALPTGKGIVTSTIVSVPMLEPTVSTTGIPSPPIFTATLHPSRTAAAPPTTTPHPTKILSLTSLGVKPTVHPTSTPYSTPMR